MEVKSYAHEYSLALLSRSQGSPCHAIWYVTHAYSIRRLSRALFWEGVPLWVFLLWRYRLLEHIPPACIASSTLMRKPDYQGLWALECVCALQYREYKRTAPRIGWKPDNRKAECIPLLNIKWITCGYSRKNAKKTAPRRGWISINRKGKEISYINSACWNVSTCTESIEWMCVKQHRAYKRTEPRRGWRTINPQGKKTSLIYFGFWISALCLCFIVFLLAFILTFFVCILCTSSTLWIAHQHIVTLRPPSAQAFFLRVLSWLIYILT